MPRDVLRRYPLFALLDAAALEAWIAAGQEFGFATGETIFQAGTPGLWIYVVLDGRVRVMRLGEDQREITLGLLGAGQVFGEYALVPPGQNTATCRAASPCRLLRLPLADLQQMLARIPRASRRLKDWMRLNTLVSHLRNEPFLGFMSGPSALKWLDRLQEVTFPASCTIQAAGLSDDSWFFVAEGRVALHEADGTMPDRRELHAGDCFGERALMGRTDLPVAETRTATKCLYLTRDEFDERPRSATHLSAQSFVLSRAATGASLTWIGQQEEADCGPAALAMIARHFGVGQSMESIRAQIPRDARGASLQELESVANALGLRAQGVRIHPNQFRHVRLPALAHYRDGHYVVLCKYGSTGIEIADPATGMVRLTPDLFHTLASGNFLLLRPDSMPGPDAPLASPPAHERDAWWKELLEGSPARSVSLLDQLADPALRELASLKLQGHTNAQIAMQLGVTERSIERKWERVRKLWTDRTASAASKS